MNANAPLWFKKEIAPEITERAKGTTAKQLDDWWFHLRNLTEDKARECVVNFFRGYESRYIARPNDFAKWLRISGIKVANDTASPSRFEQEIPKWPSGLVVIVSWYDAQDKCRERVGWLVRNRDYDEDYTWEHRNSRLYHGGFTPRQARTVNACFQRQGDAPAEWISGCPKPVELEKYLEMLTPEDEPCW